MNRHMLRLLREMFPDMFPPQRLSPQEQARRKQRGQALAEYRPWDRGKIGAVEHRAHSAMIYAQMRGITPVETGWVVQQIYLGVGGRGGGATKPKRWMYGNARKALETFAVRIGRGNGHGSPILWRLKAGDAALVSAIRKKKERRYARQKPLNSL
jgi:hypothetical protein